MLFEFGGLPRPSKLSLQFPLRFCNLLGEPPAGIHIHNEVRNRTK